MLTELQVAGKRELIEAIWGWLLAIRGWLLAAVVLALLGLLAYYAVFGDDP